jgi:hypothetical protein
VVTQQVNGEPGPHCSDSSPPGWFIQLQLCHLGSTFYLLGGRGAGAGRLVAPGRETLSPPQELLYKNGSRLVACRLPLLVQGQLCTQVQPGPFNYMLPTWSSPDNHPRKMGQDTAKAT